MLRQSVILMILVILLTACGNQQAANSIKLGALFSLTGQRASLGEKAKQGMELAFDEINARGGLFGKNLQGVYEDTLGTPSEAIKALTKLITVDKITAFVSQTSTVSVPLRDLANSNQVPQIATYTTSVAYSSEDDYTFRVNATATFQARDMAAFTLSKLTSDDRLAVVSIMDPYGQALHDFLIEEYKAKGTKPVVDMSFQPKETDFRTLLTKIKEVNANVINFIGFAIESGNFNRQLNELGLILKFVVVDTTSNNAEFFNIIRDSSYPLYITDLGTVKSHPALASYAKKHGEPMNILAANAYDAVYVFYLAAKNCPELLSACLKAELHRVRDYSGVSGPITLDKYGNNVTESYQVMRLKNGTFASN